MLLAGLTACVGFGAQQVIGPSTSVSAASGRDVAVRMAGRAAAPPTAVAPTAAPASATPATPAPLPPGVANPPCVRAVQRGDSITLIIEALAGQGVPAGPEGITVEGIQAENGIIDPNHSEVGQLVDVCVDNVDDITGVSRVPAPADPSRSGVEAQQEKLNELFAPYGTPKLAVDGVSGPLTRQQLCAARLVLGLPIARADMEPGSAEERTLMSATAVPMPATASTEPGKWVLIDKTCQIMFAGDGNAHLAFMFPVSTGQAGYETRDQDNARAFRFDPALENNGWHNSTVYPVPGDNPLNGNMYRPIYFDSGQAIHGANTVPPEPRSKGCVRLHVPDQDQLVAWLGLADVGGPVWNRDRIGLAVTVQGSY
jgi:lipoprotein-anchoring transpeptidase ErfK/SrfK